MSQFPAKKERPQDALDRAKGTDAYDKVKARYDEVRRKINERFDQGGCIQLLRIVNEKEVWMYRSEAESLGVDYDDLKAVLRRMSTIRVEEVHWTWEPLRGQIWKWWVRK